MQFPCCFDTNSSAFASPDPRPARVRGEYCDNSSPEAVRCSTAPVCQYPPFILVMENAKWLHAVVGAGEGG